MAAAEGGSAVTPDLIGAPLNRVDGPGKVTGKSQFVGDMTLPRLAHAHLVLSAIAAGRITHMEVSTAEQMPGVILVMTHLNAPVLPDGGNAAFHPPAGRKLSLLQDDLVHYNREPIAVVVADTREQAMAAADALQVRYAPTVARLDFDAGMATAHSPGTVHGAPADTQRTSPTVAAGVPQVDAVYATPMEHHNPMEPHASLASWSGDRLTLYDTTQGIGDAQETIAKIFGLPKENVRVICPFVGGGFGCKGSVWSHVPLTVMAARKLGRPVKLVLDRQQMFGPVGGRPRTVQQLRVAATADGEFNGIEHAVFSHTSTLEDFCEPSAMQTRILYSAANLKTSHRLVPLSVGTPTFQRAPGESTGTFALESALDELSVALAMDPIDLRLRNEPPVDPESRLPWSSRSLRRCYQTAAESFGWSRRNPRPRSMRVGDRLVGWGCATATYPANRSAAAARARCEPDGMIVVQCATQDLGTGTYTVMTQVAAQTLGVPVERVRFELGDSSFPRAPVSGGSQSVASVAPAVQAAARALRDKLVTLAIGDEGSSAFRASPADVVIVDGRIGLKSDTRREPLGALIARQGGFAIQVDGAAKPGTDQQAYSLHSFGAVFVELHLDAALGEIRIPRIVARYGIGRLLNAKTGKSQLLGGLVWGIGMALMEDSILDPRHGRIVNANLAEYHVPTQADVGMIDVDVVSETDTVIDSLGAKGIGEIGITGVTAAIANAAYHASGVRVRDLPLTLDKFLVPA